MTAALRWAAMRAMFNVSVGSDGQSHTTVSTNHNLSEEKGEPKRYRTEVLPLISLTPELPLGQTGSQLWWKQVSGTRPAHFGGLYVRQGLDERRK